MKALLLAATTAAVLAGMIAGHQAHAAGGTKAAQPVPSDIAALTPAGSKHVVTRADDEDGGEGLEVEGHEGADND